MSRRSPSKPPKRQRPSRRDPGLECELDLSPMIDIVFNLLVFFICATKFKTAEAAIESYLPKDQGQGPTDQALSLEEVRITVSWREGAACVRIGATQISSPEDWKAGQEPSLSPVWGRLQGQLASLIQSYQGKEPFPVILDVRNDVPHQYAVSALNEVVRAGLKEVRFAAPGRALE